MVAAGIDWVVVVAAASGASLLAGATDSLDVVDSVDADGVSVGGDSFDGASVGVVVASAVAGVSAVVVSDAGDAGAESAGVTFVATVVAICSDFVSDVSGAVCAGVVSGASALTTAGS